MRWCFFVALSLVALAVRSANGQSSSPYYGLPLGSIFYSSSSTQGEVYVSEPRKVIIVNFQHGGEAGCTTFMVGPPVQGTNVSVSPNREGVILAIQPRGPRRMRRQSETSGEKLASKEGATVIQLGNASSEAIAPEAPPKVPSPTESTSTASTRGPAATAKGIKWGDQASEEPTGPPTVPLASNLGLGIRWGDSATAPNVTAGDGRPLIRLGNSTNGVEKKSKLRELPIEYIGGINIPDDEEGKNNPNVTALLNDPFNPDLPLIPLNYVPTDPPPETTASWTFKFGGTRVTTEPNVATSTTPEPVKTFRGIPLAPAGPLAPGVAPPGIQEAPVVKILAPLQNGSSTDPEKANGSHPFFVVEDRRAQFLPPEVLELVKKDPVAPGTPTGTPPVDGETVKAPESNLPVISSPKEDVSTRYEPPTFPQDGKLYALPRFTGENVVVELPEPYEISEFQWFGIYDHCKRARTAFVNVRGVQAPKEVKLEGLRGWQYDVSSGEIIVKNCNTLLITNFTFSGAGKTEAYIYVGNGAFPHSIIQKGRAIIDVAFPDRSLKNFNNENVLVKLPNGWKTFDITWIAVFNPRGNVSYGHVLVPDLVVPACEEPK